MKWAMSSPPGGFRDRHQNQEGEEGHDQIPREVKDHGASGEDIADGGEAHEEVAGMGDTGVTQESLEIRLRNSGEVAEDQGKQGQKNEGEEQLVLEGRDGEEGLEDPDQNKEAGGLGCHGEVGGDGRGRALINIGHPELERRGGDFESESDEDERET